MSGANFSRREGRAKSPVIQHAAWARTLEWTIIWMYEGTALLAAWLSFQFDTSSYMQQIYSRVLDTEFLVSFIPPSTIFTTLFLISVI